MSSAVHTRDGVLPLPPPGFKTLLLCGVLALLLELGTVTLVGWRTHWLAHPQKTKGLDESKFIEAQMVTLPEQHEAHLHSRSAPVVRAPEPVLSKAPGAGRAPKAEEKKQLLESDQNQTKPEHPAASESLEPTHGPVAVFTPAPVLPAYLQNTQYKKTVVIEFLINAQGTVTPRLIGSSDNEELDALALATARTWQFRPAEEMHKPVDSKVRLRLVFSVE